MRHRLEIAGIVLFIAYIMPTAVSVPPIASEFYGNLTKNAIPMQNLTNITAYDQDDVFCGMFTVHTSGRFGLLSCRGDDPSTAGDEGPVAGEQIRFFSNNTKAIVFNETYNNSFWSEGDYLFVKLRILHCGDEFCDFPENCSSCSDDCGICKFCGNGVCEPEIGESCETCPQDCGLCPPPGEGSEEGGGGGAGEGAGGEMREGAYYEGIGDLFTYYDAEMPCIEDWKCTEWTDCTPAGLQYRKCEDRNKCGTDKDKPPEVQECEYITTCSDGMQNCHKMPDGSLLCEEGVDCGGPCPPCPTCHDGIQNQGETGIDCGGPCRPCPSCFDGIKNCHTLPNGSAICEEGIDCGGPCHPCRVTQVAPVPEKPAFVGCGDSMCDAEEMCTCPEDCNRFHQRLLIRGILAVVLLTLLAHGILLYLRKERKINKPTYLARLWQLYPWTGCILSLLCIVVSYDYWFCRCRATCLRFLYLPLLLGTVICLGMFQILHMLKFNEARKIRRLQKLLATHEKMIGKLVSSENILIEAVETDVAQLLSSMKSDRNFNELFERFPELMLVRKKLDSLFRVRERYGKVKIQDVILISNMRAVENELGDTIGGLMSDKEFSELDKGKAHALKEQLEILRKHYIEKKKGFSEMDRLLGQYAPRL